MNAAIAPLAGNGMAALAARFRANAAGETSANATGDGLNTLGAEIAEPADFASLLSARRGTAENAPENDDDWLTGRLADAIVPGIAGGALPPVALPPVAPPPVTPAGADVEAVLEQIDARGGRRGDATVPSGRDTGALVDDGPLTGSILPAADKVGQGAAADQAAAGTPPGRAVAGFATGLAVASDAPRHGDRPGHAASEPAATGLGRLLAAAGRTAAGAPAAAPATAGAELATTGQTATDDPTSPLNEPAKDPSDPVTLDGATDAAIDASIGAAGEPSANLGGNANPDGEASGERENTGNTLANPAGGPAGVNGAPAFATTRATEHIELPVNTPLRAPDWSGELGQRVVWMARNDVQEAQLTVNPQHLGPIEVRLSLTEDRATAQFFSPHAEVREVLQEALPRLREMLAGAGVQLGQSDVGAQSQQAFQQPGGTRHGNPDGRSFAEEHPSLGGHAAVNEVQTARNSSGNGLVDTFA